jgi:cytochrome b pre-mRNA-processing protein 3
VQHIAPAPGLRAPIGANMQSSPRGARRHHRQLRKFVGFLRQIFGGRQERERLRPLYAAIVAAARTPAFYAEGGVPDTINGRFDMVTTMLALVLLRLEATGPGTQRDSVLLTELFVDDMEAEIRQIGIGDLVVGKHVGRMMGALGGRLGALRSASAESESLRSVVRRNIFHEAPPSEAAVAFVTERLAQFREQLAMTPLESVLAGRMPAP